MKILFMGTPEFAVPSLNALLGAGHTVCGVFTQPDKPKNRGMKLLPSPVKVCALSHEIPVFQPAKMRDGEALGYLRELDPELIVVAAYGKILPSEILDYPVKGCINVHSSLLPKYRGAAPINWAILNGEAVTGVTIMHMAPALDAGDIIAQASTPIGADETAPTLTARLAELGAELLVSTVEAIGAGTAARTPQDEADSTYAPMLSRELSPMDWSKPARTLHDQVRGLQPWPVATMELQGKRFKVHETRLTAGEGEPGQILGLTKTGLVIACGQGAVEIRSLQAEGGKRMNAPDYFRGHPLKD